MKNKRQIVENQIHLQEKIQSAGFNIVECGNCGTALLHECGDESIECFCGEEMSLSDCPDLYYSGMETNQEFNEKQVIMKKIQFQGTEQELYNLQNLIEISDNSLPKEVQTTVCVLEEDDFENKHHSELTDDEFLELARNQGRVYSLDGFSEAFNLEEINSTIDIIRFINIEV